MEASPDFVGLTDVADLMGVSRQYVRKLMLSRLESFPNPVHGSGSGAYWHLARVLHWLSEQGVHRPNPALLEVAQVAMQVNLAKEPDSVEPRVRREVQALVA